MRLSEADRALLSRHSPTFEGCCGNDDWRGRVCSYHEGFLDGYDAAERDAAPNDS